MGSCQNSNEDNCYSNQYCETGKLRFEIVYPEFLSLGPKMDYLFFVETFVNIYVTTFITFYGYIIK